MLGLQPDRHSGCHCSVSFAPQHCVSIPVLESWSHLKLGPRPFQMSFRDFSIVYALYLYINTLLLWLQRVFLVLWTFFNSWWMFCFNFSEVHLLLRLTAAASVALRNGSTWSIEFWSDMNQAELSWESDWNSDIPVVAWRCWADLLQPPCYLRRWGRSENSRATNALRFAQAQTATTAWCLGDLGPKERFVSESCKMLQDVRCCKRILVFA